MSNILFNENLNLIIVLFISNKNQYLHGREISKILNKPQKTIHNNLNLLVNENVLEKSIAGKNINYKLNLLAPNLDEILLSVEIFKLNKLKEDFEISQILNDLKNLIDVPILLFGSYSKGYQNKDSDLDILILSDKKRDIRKIQSKYIIKINPIYISMEEFENSLTNKNEFSREVLKNHILIKDFEYFIKLWRMYYGTN